jgi:hypothetical protein
VVVSPECKADSFPLVAFLDSLRVELASSGLRCCTLADLGDTTSTAASLRVTIESVPCVTDADRVHIAARASEGTRVVEREVTLADMARAARPRALALAAAELIRLIGQEPPKRPKMAVAVPSQPPVALLPSPIPDVTRKVGHSMYVEVEARNLPKRDTTLWGARARLAFERRDWHADLDFGANYARARVELGDLLLRSMSLGFGLGPRLETRTFIIDLGLRAELGWAWIRGTSSFADVHTGAGSAPFSSVGARASLEVPSQTKIRSCLTLEGGGVARSVNGVMNGQAVSGIAGSYLLAAIGIGVSP